MLKTVLPFVLISIGLLGPGHAATLSLVASASALDNSGVSDAEFVPNTFGANGEANASARVFQSDPTGDLGNASAIANTSGSVANGTLRFLLGANREGLVCGTPCGASANAFAQTSFRSQYTVTGSGILTAFFDVTASWVADIYNFDASVEIAGAGPIRRNAVSVSSDPFVANVDTLLDVAVEINDAIDLQLEINWEMNGSISTSSRTEQENLFLTAQNTGVAFVSATSGLTVSPGNPLFLSDPAFQRQPAIIPLPAGFVLLLSALGLVAATRLPRQDNGPASA